MEDNAVKAPKTMMDDEKLFQASHFVVRQKSVPAVVAPTPMPLRIPAPIPALPVQKIKVTPLPPRFVTPVDDPKPLRRGAAVVLRTAPPTLTASKVAKEPSMQVADQVMEDLNLPVDDLLRKRFRTMVDSYTHGIRSRDEVFTLLERSVKVGGMGLADEQARAVLASVDQRLPAPPSSPSQRSVNARSFPTSHDQPAQPRQTPSALSSSTALQLVKIQEQQQRSHQALPENPPTKTVSAEAAEHSQENVAAPQPVSIAKPPVPHPMYGLSANARASRPQIVTQDFTRRTVTDVKSPVTVIGPKDELRTMTLKDWRRLGASPQDVGETIREKLDVLGQDSFAEKLSGIQNWHRSPLYNLYLTIGRESITTGATIVDVIQKRHANNQEYLTEEEFQTIADLNKDLRF